MTTETVSQSAPAPAAQAAPAAVNTVQGMRKNGKQWHAPRTAFRKNAGLTSFAQRAEERKARDAVKAKEKEMKDAKEAERQRRIEAIRTKRETKAEKERYAKMEEKMHKKRVERLKRREKRNKVLNS